jgi:hypothetical protein
MQMDLLQRGALHPQGARRPQKQFQEEQHRLAPELPRKAAIIVVRPVEQHQQKQGMVVLRPEEMVILVLLLRNLLGLGIVRFRMGPHPARLLLRRLLGHHPGEEALLLRKEEKTLVPAPRSPQRVPRLGALLLGLQLLPLLLGGHLRQLRLADNTARNKSAEVGKNLFTSDIVLLSRQERGAN